MNWKKSRCEICEKYFSCDKHHIQSRADNGSNELFNIATICPCCHRLCSTGELQIIKRYLTSDGFLLETFRNNQRYIGKKAFDKPVINNHKSIEQLTLF